MSDPELVALARQGDKNAFHSLYLRHHGRVYAISLRMAGQASVAEDITQECFVRLWHKLAQFEGNSEFSTWLHRLCVRQAINSIKAQKSFWQRFVSHEQLNQQDQAFADEHTSSTEYHQLDKLIVRLPERMRMVFVLAALEGYQHDEIAKLLGIAVGTSKNQYFKAKQLLQEMLS
ncbi:RNA polymerase sigma factor [Shewanella sp. WXL01]|uniref:RNA polymerase sigma factor n=1 Tax=Shewanella sp. WXL01 TaxID=2709721 RepID=UPI00143834B7|nr:RNA polymerase sigma factor [Shewanella sp. WXL01]NKF50884.1 RNA polymerase sigma factor [Shewanella sp. WXL01]